MEELRKITAEYDELSDKVTILVREPQGKDRAAHIAPPTQCKLAFSRQVAFILYHTYYRSLQDQITYAHQAGIWWLAHVAKINNLTIIINTQAESCMSAA